MNIESINSINDLLYSFTSVDKLEGNNLDQYSKQYFSELLNPIDSTKSIEATKNAQKALSEWSLGADITAKTAGSFSQAINKLVNMT